jgi:hypothetical protein
MAYKFQLGDALMSGSLNQEDGITSTTIDATTDFTIDGLVITADTITNDAALSVVVSAGDLTANVAGDIALSADGGNVTMDDGTTTVFDFNTDDPELKIMDDAQVANYCSIAVGANGATTMTTVDADAAAAHLIITADGTVDIDSTGLLTLDSGAGINLEPAAGSSVLIDGTVSIDGGAVAGVTTLAASGLLSIASVSMDDGSTLGPDSVADLWTFSADGDTVQKDGAYDFNLASHDGTNGLKLAGTLVTSTAAKLNYTDISTLGAGEASKFLSLDASADVASGLRSLTGSGNLRAGGVFSDGALHADGNSSFLGHVKLGNAAGDLIGFSGSAGSSLVPDVDSMWNLGSDSKRWSTIYVDSIVGASVAWDVVICDSADTISASAELAVVRQGNGITVNLPAAVAGRNIRVKLSGGVGDVLVAPATGEIIEGLAPNTKIRLESTGSSATFVAMETDGWVIL